MMHVVDHKKMLMHVSPLGKCKYSKWNMHQHLPQVLMRPEIFFFLSRVIKRSVILFVLVALLAGLRARSTLKSNLTIHPDAFGLCEGSFMAFTVNLFLTRLFEFDKKKNKIIWRIYYSIFLTHIWDSRKC